MSQTGIRKEQFESAMLSYLTTGWKPITGTTLDSDGPSSGLDTILLEGDWTDRIKVTDRFKVNDNGTVKQGIIHLISYSDVMDTTYLNVFFSVESGTRVRLATTTLSEAYYSDVRFPMGFPNSREDNWALVKEWSDLKTADEMTENRWSTFGTDSAKLEDIPPGNWETFAYGHSYAQKVSTPRISIRLFLSEYTNSQTNVPAEAKSASRQNSDFYVRANSLRRVDLFTSETDLHIISYSDHGSSGDFDNLELRTPSGYQDWSIKAYNLYF